MRTRTLVAVAAAVLVLVAPARAAGGFRAFVYPDRANPDLVVAVDDFRINETVWDYGGVQHVWVNGPAGHFQLPFERVRQIEFVRYVGRDFSRADWTWYEVKVTGTEPGESYTGRLRDPSPQRRGRRRPLVPVPFDGGESGEGALSNRDWRACRPGDDSVGAPVGRARAACRWKSSCPSRRDRPTAPPPVPSEEELFARMSLDDLNRQNPLDDVFFDFDKSDIRPDGEATLRRNAAWLRKWPSVAVRVDGCADPRGTNEYNFGLGMRRADVIRAYLVSQGVALERIEVVAVGETQLVCTEQTEECWARNRRGHLLITAK